MESIFATRGTERIHGPLAHETEVAQHHDGAEPYRPTIPFEDEVSRLFPSLRHLDPELSSDQENERFGLARRCKKSRTALWKSVISIVRTFL